MTESVSATTPFSTKCEILGELWLDYKNDPQFRDFIEYNDLGLPLAYAIANGLAKPEPKSNKFIDESFDLLLEGLGLTDEVSWSNLEQMLGWAEEDEEEPEE